MTTPVSDGFLSLTIDCDFFKYPPHFQNPMLHKPKSTYIKRLTTPTVLSLYHLTYLCIH